MKRVILAAAVAMCFAPAYAANQTYTVDLVVVGAGAGGSVAALSAVEGGLKTLLLEKNAFAGGAGNFMEGSFAAESFMQKEAGVKLTKIQAFNEMAAYHPGPSTRRSSRPSSMNPPKRSSGSGTTACTGRK